MSNEELVVSMEALGTSINLVWIMPVSYTHLTLPTTILV